jgi:hypothetical protein
MVEILRLIFIAIATTVGIKTNTFFIGKGYDELTSTIFAAILSILLAKGLDLLIIELPFRLAFTRRILDPKAKFEGYWLSSFDSLPERPYSYGVIEYNPHSKSYVYYGYGFDKGGILSASWRSTYLEVDLKRDEIRYAADGQVYGEGSEFAKSYGTLTFVKNLKGEYTLGKGFFVNSGTDAVKYHYTFEKLDGERLKELIEKKNFSTHKDMQQIIREIHSSKDVKIGAKVDNDKEKILSQIDTK